MNKNIIATLINVFESGDKVTLIIGAGASVRAGIPSSESLVKEAAEKYPTKINKLTAKDRKDYGAVMAVLPSKQRQKLIQPHLENAELSWGHLALACLLKAGYINRVLTFNFDMVIEKALARVDYQIPSYDFGIAPTDRIRELAAPSIVHLHGQSLGLRLLNSKEDTQKHAEDLRPLIKHELEDSVVVVMGYSGTSDQAFQIIEEEYLNEEWLYWLGYGEKPDKKLKKLLENEYAEFHGGCDYDLVMMQLAEQLDCFPPKLLTNPMDHVVDGLQDMAEFPYWDGRKADLKRVLEVRMKKTAETWEGDRTKQEKNALSLFGPSEAGNESVMDEVSQDATYWSLIYKANDLVPDNPDPNHPLENFDKAFDLYEKATQLSKAPHEALTIWGNRLLEKARFLEGQAALDCIDTAMDKYEAALNINSDIFGAWFGWSSALMYKADYVDEDEAQKLRELAEEKNRQASSRVITSVAVI